LTRLALGIVIVGASTGARADGAGAPNTGAVTSVETTANVKPRFYGFTVDLTTADGSGLNSVGHNYRNDFVWYFEPAWNIGQMYLRGSRWRTLQLQARFSLTANVSGTDEANFSGSSNASPAGTCPGTTINDNGTVDPGSVGYCNPSSNTRRADYSDVWLTLRSPRIYTIPKINVYLNPALRVILPTSVESRFQTLVMSLTPSIALGRTFWRDKLRVGYGFGFTKNFHQYTSSQLTPIAGGPATTAGGNLSDGPYGAGLSNFYLDPSRDGTIGGYNVNYSLSHTISGGIQLSDKWSIDVLYVIIDSFTYDHSCATSNVMANGSPYDTCSAGDRVAANSGASLARPSHRDSQVFWATLGYQPLDWLGLSLAWINWAPLQRLDSSYRQGIISTNYDAFTTIQLAATVTVDKLAARYWRKQ
ncbi:MAG: hypothetical protein ACXVDD_28865, partial [Polyangia bacterium]